MIERRWLLGYNGYSLGPKGIDVMFFIMGITDGRKDFSFTQLVTCAVCGKYGCFNVFMTYMKPLTFFI